MSALSDPPSIRPPGAPNRLPIEVVRRCTLRLPVVVAARLEAWCEMHPQQSRAALISSLLAAGLAEAERSLPGERGPGAEPPSGGRAPVYLPTGPFAEFHGLVSKHHLQLEQALDPASRDAPEMPYPAVGYQLGEE